MSSANIVAKAFKQLHQPGKPVLLANVWDVASANLVATLPSSKVLATSSFAIARANGVEDDDLTLAMNLEAVKAIGAVAKEHEKPLTVDIQDGYGPKLEEAIAGLVRIGASGANLEDFNIAEGKMYAEADAVRRIERSLAVAHELGVPDFVLNARCDVLKNGGSLEDVLSRGKAYLEAGAATFFPIPGPQRKILREDIVKMVAEFDGQLNAGWNPSGALSIKELSELGVARVSVGPGIHVAAMNVARKMAEDIVNGTQS